MHIVEFLAGEVIGDAPDRRVEILCEHEALHATWSRFGPGRDGADLHVHRLHHDVFVVLAGELTVRLRDGEVVVPAGSLACVPPSVVHGFRNASLDNELRYLNLHAPGVGFADYLRGLRDGVRVVYDQYDPPGDGGLDPAGMIIGLTLSLPHLTVDDQRPSPTDRLECLYVLEGDGTVNDRLVSSGTWITVLPGQPCSLDGSGHLVHVSAQI